MTALIVALAIPASAQVLSWTDTNPPGIVAGFEIRHRTSGLATNLIVVGNTNRAPAGIVPGVTNWWMVRAVGVDGLKSDWTDEIWKYGLRAPTDLTIAQNLQASSAPSPTPPAFDRLPTREEVEAIQRGYEPHQPAQKTVGPTRLDYEPVKVRVWVGTNWRDANVVLEKP
jgi:hypothetical protein